jgi:hypothetical protein
MRQQDPTPPRIARWLAHAAAACLALAGGESRGQSRAYEVTIASHIEIRMPNQPKAREMDVASELRYGLTDVEGGVEVSVEGLGVRQSIEEQTLVESKISKAGASFRQGTQPPTAYDAAKAPPAMKKVLDEFGKPLARIGLDKDGGEAGRTLLVEPTATLVEHGVLDNCRLFHPPFPAEAESWDAPAKVAFGSGQFAVGTLHYEKAGKTDDGLERVTVGGELKGAGKIQGGEVADATYKVDGLEFYDPGAKAWASGLLKIDMSFKIVTPSQPLGSASGTMEVRLRRADGAKPPSPPPPGS